MTTLKYALQTVRLLQHTFLFLLLGLSFSIASAQNHPDVSSRRIADEYDYQNMPIDSSLEWIKQNRNINFEDTYQFFDELKDKVYASNDPRQMAILHSRIARWYKKFYTPEVDSSIYHLEKSIHFYKQIGDKSQLSYNYRAITLDYMNKNELDKAQNAIMNAIALFQELEDTRGMALIETRLVSLYRLSDEPEKAIIHADKIINKFKNTYEPRHIIMILIDKMNAYASLDNFDDAIQTANEALAILEKTDLKRKDYFKGFILKHRGHTFIKSKQYKEAFLDYENAEKLGWPEDHEGKARALFYQGKHKEALSTLKPIHEASDFENIENEAVNLSINENYLVSAQIYEKNNLYKEAYYLYKFATEGIKATLEDKVENLESEAIIKYETGKKDQAIASQELQLAQKTKIQNLTFGVLGLLASLLFGLFYFFRKNKIITKELDLKNQQNEVLLKEIHHRVKNNLQTISSLLSLQSKSIKDANALDAVQESRNRVTSMALIHQKLYQGENLAAIEMRDYFETIGKAILHSFGEKAKGIELEVEMPEIELDVDTAIPIGLITNELITNSLKYAFTNTSDGKISISMTKAENNLIQLSIADNGINYNTSISKGGTGFGTMLIKLLTTQLSGQLKQTTAEGTHTIIQFSLNTKAA